MKCEDCVHGNFSRLNWKSRSTQKASVPPEVIHTSLCSLPQQSRQGSRYFMTFLDEATHYAVIYFLKSKGKLLECFKNYVSVSERETGCKVKKVCCNNGGEYISKTWSEFCQNRGIRHLLGPPHSPEMNGTAERFNCTFLERLLPTIFHAELPTRFWEDALPMLSCPSISRRPDSIPENPLPFPSGISHPPPTLNSGPLAANSVAW